MLCKDIKILYLKKMKSKHYSLYNYCHTAQLPSPVAISVFSFEVTKVLSILKENERKRGGDSDDHPLNTLHIK